MWNSGNFSWKVISLCSTYHLSLWDNLLVAKCVLFHYKCIHAHTHTHTHTHRCVWTRCSMHRITSEPFTNLVEQVGQLLWFCFANKDLETWKVTVIGCQAKPCHSIPDPQTPSPASFPLCQFPSVRGISHWQYKIPMVPGILLKKAEFHVKSFPFKFFFKSFWIYQGERCSLEDQNVFSTLKYLLICLFLTKTEQATSHSTPWATMSC